MSKWCICGHPEVSHKGKYCDICAVDNFLNLNKMPIEHYFQIDAKLSHRLSNKLHEWVYGSPGEPERVLA